jgi:DNA polymerase-4
MARTIIHIDLDAFFCAVEELNDPSLRGLPFAVGGPPERRGVVASCSYPARRCGVRSAMPMSRALALCPRLVVVPPHFEWYREASHAVMERLRQVTPLLEQISIDEAFLDVSDAGIPGPAIARDLQASIRRDFGLPCSLGVATSKLVAKVATDVGKASVATGDMPNALCVVAPGEEAAFLAPLSAQALWGVGPKTAERLAQMGLRTIGDIARYPVSALVHCFGKNGAELAQHARGIDNREIVIERVSKSISKEITFSHDTNNRRLLRQTLESLANDVALQLRHEKLSAGTVKLKVRWSDFVTITRQGRLPCLTDSEAVIRPAALRLFAELSEPEREVRLLGVGVSGLNENQQLSLWESVPFVESVLS